MILIVYIILYVKKKKKDSVLIPPFKLHQTKIDCIANEIPCFTNAQCSELCVNVIQNCNEKTKICQTAKDDPNTIKCNEKHGILRIITDDIVTGRVIEECKSVIAPYIFTDDDNIKDPWCANGTFNINLLEENIDVNKCTCDENKYLWFISEHNVPMCLPLDNIKMVPDFVLNSQILNKNGKVLKKLQEEYEAKFLSKHDEYTDVYGNSIFRD